MSDFTKSKQNVNVFSPDPLLWSQREGKFLVACISDWSFLIQYISFIMMPVSH